MSEVTPRDREEKLLAAIAEGATGKLPTPRNRKEKLLKEIYDHGGTGGGGTGGVTPAQVKTILLANTDNALNGASSNPIANKALVAALADYVKSTDLSIPTKVSELTNDKKYQTDSDLVTALTPYAKSDDVTAEIIAEIAKVVADAPESFDTLKEMADWIAHHEDDATAMNSAIQDNKTNIKTLQTNKANASDLTAHTDNAGIHVTAENKTLWNTVGGKVDKTSIATAISNTPSDEKVASEKAVHNKNTINHKIIKDIDILDYASKVVDNFEFVRGFNVINSPYGDSDSPNNDMLYMINRISVSGYCRLIAYDLRSTFVYMKTQLNGTWTDWVRLTVASGTEDYQTLTTPQIKDGTYMSNSVLWGTDRDFLVLDINKPDKTVRRLQFDTVEKAIGMYDLDYNTDAITEVGTLRFTKNSYVPPTNIAPADETKFVSFKGNQRCNYCVKNGVCYVSLFNIKVTSTGKTTTGVFLPKCLNGMAGTFLTGNGDVTPHAYVHVIPATGELSIDVKDANVNLFGSFSYPVAES